MKWEMVKLGEVFKTSSGGTPSRAIPNYYNGDICWVKSGDLNYNIIFDTEEKISNEAVKNSSAKIFPKGTLLIAMYGATIGKLAMLGIDATTNQAICGIFENGKDDLRYVYYFLLFKKPDLLNIGMGGAQPNISQDVIRNLPIPLPPLATQQRIADILDKADALRQKDQALLRKYEELAQAVFVDMFGDLMKNEKGWDLVSLENCCSNKDDIKCGPFGTQLLKEEFQSHGVPLWGIRDVNKHFSNKPREFLSVEKSEELKQYNIIKGDLVMTRKGTIGNCSVYMFEKDGIMHSDLLRIRVDQSKCNPTFLSFQLMFSNYIINQISQISQGAIMAGINVSKLKSLYVHLPPISFQLKFEKIVTNLNFEKSNILKNHSESLFQSLLQKAFTGELVS